MASIGTALITDNHIVNIAEQVHNFALSFVTPLQAHHTSVRHAFNPSAAQTDESHISAGDHQTEAKMLAGQVAVGQMVLDF
jgi:hypothetical protein